MPKMTSDEIIEYRSRVVCWTNEELLVSYYLHTEAVKDALCPECLETDQGELEIVQSEIETRITFGVI